MEITLYPARTEHFDWLIVGTSGSGPDGLWFAEPILPTDVLSVLKQIAETTTAVLGIGSWLIVSGNEVVGMCGIKGLPNTRDLVEIGYNVVEGHRGKGIAGRAVARMLDILGTMQRIRGVIAETAIDNPASIRVLEHNGFVRIGRRYDQEDGNLIIWRWVPSRRKG